MKSIRKIILIPFLLISISTEIIACTCGILRLTDLQKSEIENSECIFIGEVFEIDKSTQTFKIKVSESLDGGDISSNIYIGKNWKYCSPYVDEKGKWIVYGFMEDGFLRLNLCGISRSFDYPVVYPILPIISELNEKPKSEPEYKMEADKRRSENIKKGLIELNAEIAILRKMRNKKRK